MADVLESSPDAGKLANSASYQEQNQQDEHQNGAGNYVLVLYIYIFISVYYNQINTQVDN